MQESCHILPVLVYWKRCGPSAGREGSAMEPITTYILSVLAGIASYYICKGLDGKK